MTLKLKTIAFLIVHVIHRSPSHRQPALRTPLPAREQVIPAPRTMRVSVGSHLRAVLRSQEQQEDHRPEGDEHDAQAGADAEHGREPDEAAGAAGDDDVGRDGRQQFARGCRRRGKPTGGRERGVLRQRRDVAPEQHAPADPTYADDRPGDPFG